MRKMSYAITAFTGTITGLHLAMVEVVVLRHDGVLNIAGVSFLALCWLVILVSVVRRMGKFSETL